MEKQYWLADGKNIDQYGTILNIELIHGPHNTSTGVKEAKEIIKLIGADKKQNRNYIMISVEEL